MRRWLVARRYEEHGFTLVELLVVLVVIAVLLAIAVPAYLGYRQRAADHAAKANLRAAMPAAEAYYAEHETYVAMDHAALALIDGGVSPSLAVTSTGASDYCITDTVAGRAWSLLGPGATPVKLFPNATCS